MFNTYKMKELEKGLKRMDSIISANLPAGGAKISKDSFLFGEPFDNDYGDVYDDGGDIDDEFGDLDDTDLDGDVDTLSAFEVLSGGPVARKHPNLKRNLIRGAGVATGLGATYLTGRALARFIQKRKLRRAQNRLSGRNSGAFRAAFGKIHGNQGIGFVQAIGAKINSAPIPLNSHFTASEFKLMLDKQAVETPFLQETAAGVFGGVFWTVTTIGAVTPRYVPVIFIKFGANALAGVPASILTVRCTIPLIDGTTLTVATEPFLLTFEKGFDVKIQITPWMIVASRPLPILGKYDNLNPITVQIDGLPGVILGAQPSAVSVIIPGSLHPWVSNIRKTMLPA